MLKLPTRKKKKKYSLERKIKLHGYLFLLPWLFGMTVFFLLPLLQSFYWALCDIRIVKNGVKLDFVGTQNLKYMLFEDPDFVRSVTESIGGLVLNILIILTFSIFVGVLLVQKFKGRTLMRGLFFLPVVISTSVVVKIVKENVFTAASNTEATQIFQTDAVAELITSLGLDGTLVTQFTSFAARIFDLTWESGLQILLFLAAMQAIPTSFFEVCELEGANAWERFWYVTFPMILPTTLIAFVYTVINNFTSVSNEVMQGILEQFNNMEYGLATAAAVVYFLVVLVLMGIVFLAMRKHLTE